MSSDWTTQITPDRFIAELKPQARRFGWFSFVAWTAVSVFLLFAVVSKQEIGWVAAIACACAAAFPTALWLGMRQSHYTVTLDFRKNMIEIDVKRSFDQALHYEDSLSAIDPRAEGNLLRLGWREDADRTLVISSRDEKEALTVVRRIQAASKNP